MQLNHTIVWSTDPQKSAAFLARILGRPSPLAVWHFHVVTLDNALSLDFTQHDAPIQSQHYAFLISEAEFDQVFARITEEKVPYWADPMQRQAGQINRGDGGRGLYFEDPDGHLLEVITRPYGNE